MGRLWQQAHSTPAPSGGFQKRQPCPALFPCNRLHKNRAIHVPTFTGVDPVRRIEISSMTTRNPHSQISFSHGNMSLAGPSVCECSGTAKRYAEPAKLMPHPGPSTVARSALAGCNAQWRVFWRVSAMVNGRPIWRIASRRGRLDFERTTLSQNQLQQQPS
jgi:hypothetical protein